MRGRRDESGTSGPAADRTGPAAVPPRTVPGDAGAAHLPAGLPSAAASALGPRALWAVQGAAGNRAAARLLGNRTAPPPASTPGPPVVARAPLAPIAEEEAPPGRQGDTGVPRPRRPARRTAPAAGPGGGPTEAGRGDGTPPPLLVLPPYLRDMTSAGLSTASGLTGHEFVGHVLTRVTGRTDGDVAAVGRELAGRPESFYGQGRAFSVRGADADYDVTVSVCPGSGADPGPSVFPNPAATTPRLSATRTADAEAATDPATKVDQQHSAAATVATDAVRSRQFGLSGSGTVLAPTPAPGVWAGAELAAGAALRTDRDVHTTRTVSEPRTVRSAGGTVRSTRRVTYTVRVDRQGPGTAPQEFHGAGTLTMRVPSEHLVPMGTVPPAHGPELGARQRKAVRQATSMAAISVEDGAAPHAGGGGLFDTVASVLHPAAVAPGSAGRARLYEATSTTTVLQDLPRMLAGWVASEDLDAGAAGAASAYRMRADIVSLAPGWGAGQTQLRTHQQVSHGAGATVGKGSNGTAGAGPAVGLGAPGAGPAVRFSGMGVAGYRRMRFTAADQTAATRQGAEVRGGKVLYRARVRLTVQGTGPAAPGHTARPARRGAEHVLDAWVTLRAEEAHHLGLPLPAGTEPGELYTKPDRTGPDGTPVTGPDGLPEKTERRLPFDAAGSSVALTHLDTRPLIAAVTRLFATEPRLAGYLPPFGAQATGRDAGRADAEAQRRNYRELVTVLSETNLRANKDQLLSTGVPVRLRRKTALASHDVQVRVRGQIGALTYLGDTADWLVRSSAGVGSGGQSGAATSRRAGAQAGVRGSLVPGALSVGAVADAAVESSRRSQGGPVTRTDSLNSGDVSTSTFGTKLWLGVDVTMTSRERTAKRAVTPGRPGRHRPEAERIASSDDRGLRDNPLRFDKEGQDVRLSTPTAFTVDEETHARLDRHRTAGRTRTGPLDASGIGDLTTRAPGRGLRDWDFVETVGDAKPVRDLAFQLLAQAARRGRSDARGDTAFETEGLAPRLAVEDRFAPQAVTAALRQGVTSGWVVADLRHPRRLTALDGAVGTRFALTRPRVRHRSTGAGMENMALGGHQGSGQRARTKSTGFTVSGRGAEGGDGWGLAESASYRGATATSDATAGTLSGTVERNAVNPRSRPLYLVQCDLDVSMVAEVTVNGSGPYAAAGHRTVPGAVGLWLTAAQLAAAGLRDPEERAREQRDALALLGPDGLFGSAAPEPGGKGKQPDREDGRDAASASGSGDPGTARGAAPGSALPGHAGTLPVGFGLIDELPDFVPLLNRLRAAVDDRSLADDLLPRRRLDDTFDNVQRLLRVLDRDGATGLLAGAMDGGVPVELLRNSSTPGRRATSYWAVFHVRRTGPGTVVGPSAGDREMEYATVAAAQSAHGHQESRTDGLAGGLTGGARSEDGAVGQADGTAGPLAGRTESTGRSRTSRTQTGLRAIVGDAPSTKVSIPVRAELELRSAGGRLATVGHDASLVHRALEKDLAALARMSPVPQERAPGQHPAVAAGAHEASPGALSAWRAAGATLPLEAQADGFRGAPQVRALIGGAMADAHADTRFRRPGNAAYYAHREAVSTEWLQAALPLLVAGGAELPPVHASGVEGQDIDCSLHARLLDGRLLGESEEMTFETVAQSTPEDGRPAGVEHRQAGRRGRAGGLGGGAGPVRVDQSGMTNTPGAFGAEGGPTGTAGNAAGTVPLQKPKEASALVQFTLEFRAVARVRHRHTQRLRGPAAVGVRDGVLVTPVVIRMPASQARRFADG
ncbi:hypothetical protein [Streptomyces flaveolus]|uniref:hypothetical protein n=1 Tax=Streptomyces flaveolus TaxID=67297 RepID=UPI0033168B59